MLQNRPWTEGEREFLRQYYQVYSLAKLGHLLQRTKGAISTQVHILKIKKSLPKRKPRTASMILVWDLEANKPTNNESKKENSEMETE